MTNRPTSSTVPVRPPGTDEVTDLEWPQHHQEYAGREVRKQAAPRRADRQARTGQQRRETRGLHTEIAQNRDDQRDVQNYRNRIADEAQQCRIDLLPRQRLLDHPDGETNEPAADHIQDQRAHHLQADAG